MDIPLAVTAVDLITNKRVIIKEGKSIKACVQAYPFRVFQPVYEGMVLVDGGILGSTG